MEKAKLPIKTKAASYLLAIIGLFSIFVFSFSVGTNYHLHVSFLAAPIILFATLVLLNQRWAWYALIIATLLWILSSLFGLVSLTNGEFLISVDSFLFNLIVSFIPLTLLFSDYRKFTKLKGIIFLSVLIILIVSFIAIGFYLDWSLKSSTLRARDFKGNEAMVYFGFHRNYSGDLEVYKNGKLVLVKDIHLIVLNTASSFVGEKEKMQQEGSYLDLRSGRIYELTFEDESGINHGDKYTLNLDNKTILNIAMDPPITEVKDVQVTSNGLKIILHNSGGPGKIWTEPPQIIPLDLKGFNLPSCRNVKNYSGLNLKGNDEITAYYNCKNMVTAKNIDKINVCVGFSTRTERNCKVFNFKAASLNNP